MHLFTATFTSRISASLATAAWPRIACIREFYGATVVTAGRLRNLGVEDSIWTTSYDDLRLFYKNIERDRFVRKRKEEAVRMMFTVGV